MKQIAIRSIPAVGAKATEKKKRGLHHDLDHLAGTWSKKEAAEFDKTLKVQRKISSEIWRKSK